MTTITTQTKPGLIPPPPPSNLECCMCGDFGLSYELFQCKICHFRSQHRYCSNVYPKAESYEVCNWCLNQESKEKSQQNSSNSSSSNKKSNTNSSEENGSSSHNNNNNNKKINEKLTIQVSPIKKQRSPERSSPQSHQSTRRRLISNGRLEQIKLIRRTKSEEISKINNNNNNNNKTASTITKHVFKNKVRRYKLLDEVSS